MASAGYNGGNNMDKMNGLFHSAIFGFARRDVLAYIDSICSENSRLQAQLTTTIEGLQAQLTNHIRTGIETQNELNEKIKVSEQAAADLTLKLEEQTAKLDEQSAQVEQAKLEAQQAVQQAQQSFNEKAAALSNEVDNYKAKIYAREQEFIGYKNQNSSLEQQNIELKAQIEQMKIEFVEKSQIQSQREDILLSRQAEIEKQREEILHNSEAQVLVAHEKAREIIEEANRKASEVNNQAKGIVEKAEKQADEHKALMADGVAELGRTVSALKNSLSTVETQVEKASVDMSTVTEEIRKALSGVEQKMLVISEQVQDYPHVKPLPHEKKEIVMPKLVNEVERVITQQAANFSQNNAQNNASRGYRKPGVNGILDSIAKLLDK